MRTSGAKSPSRHRIGRLVSILLVIAMFSPAAASAQTDPGPTDVTAVMPAAAADIAPGLCGLEDTPLCVGPHEAQIHLYSLACSATGTFEGAVVSPEAPCGIDLSAFMVPSAEGLMKPNCVTSHTYTSDAARMHGKPVNEVVADGVARKMQLSYPGALLGFRTATGWVDGPDRDHDPVGDHALVFSIQVRPRETTLGVPCLTTPFTSAALTAVLRVFDGPVTSSASP